jgi:hypothetical protein
MLSLPVSALKFTAGGFLGRRFFLGRFLWRRFRWLRLIGRGVDNFQTTTGKGVNSGPRSAQISEYNLTLASFVCADGNVARNARALDCLAFRHAKRDAASHRRS